MFFCSTLLQGAVDHTNRFINAEVICDEQGHDILIRLTEHDTMLVPEEEEDFCEACKGHLAKGKCVHDVPENIMYTY